MLFSFVCEGVRYFATAWRDNFIIMGTPTCEWKGWSRTSLHIHQRNWIKSQL